MRRQSVRGLGKNRSMITDYQVQPLSQAAFAELFDLSEEELALRSIARYTVDTFPGYPCRVSLRHLALGESALLLNYTHQPAATPYHACGPIFVGRTSVPAQLERNQLPALFNDRPISVRAFDAVGMMLNASVVGKDGLDEQIRENFKVEAVAYQHLHFARQGCFACQVERALPEGCPMPA